MPSKRRLTNREKLRRALSRAMVKAAAALQTAASNWRKRDKDAWTLARWPKRLAWICGVNCLVRHAHAPRLWCKTCTTRTKLSVAYERLAPPSWRSRVPHGTSGPVSVRVRVDGARRAGTARKGSGQTPRRQLTKDGRCKTCRGTGRVMYKLMPGIERSQTCLVCDGSGGRRFAR